MEPVKNEILYRVKQLTQVDNIATANEYLELGWTLLQIISIEYNDYYTLGWTHDEEPESPERNPMEFYIPDEVIGEEGNE